GPRAVDLGRTQVASVGGEDERACPAVHGALDAFDAGGDAGAVGMQEPDVVGDADSFDGTAESLSENGGYEGGSVVVAADVELLVADDADAAAMTGRPGRRLVKATGTVGESSPLKAHVAAPPFRSSAARMAAAVLFGSVAYGM